MNKEGHFEQPDLPQLSRHDPTPLPFLWWVVEEDGVEISREKVYD